MKQRKNKIYVTSANRIERIKHVIQLTEDWCNDQSNGMTDGEICVSAMKDIRRIVNGTK